MTPRVLAVVVGVVMGSLALAWRAHISPAADRDRRKVAERIDREGVLPSGGWWRGLRAGGAEVSGAQSACVQCHRRSGMGMAESSLVVPPITGQFLYQPRASAREELDAHHTRGPDLA